MRWATAISERPTLDAAVEDAVVALRAELGAEEPDLVLCFVSSHYRAGFATLPQLVRRLLPEALLLGCSAGGVVGGGREVEQRRALSLTAAVLPGVSVRALDLPAEGMPEEDDIAGWRMLVGGEVEPQPHFILLPDPFSCDIDQLCVGLDRAFPDGCKIGGLCSGGRGPGDGALFIGEAVRASGCVGVALSGNIVLDTIVAQGCRPIGTPLVVTRCHDNIIEEVTGGPPVKVLRELYETLPALDRQLMHHSLFLGIEMRSNQVELHQGDFLIRNILGLDPHRGALVVGARVQPWQAVQFHLRDARTSAEDLEQRLVQYRETMGSRRPRGALLFSCLGRGEHLYGRPNHDSEVFQRLIGPVPLGGFFCSGEIGPVGGSTFVHGYTSAFGLFRERHEGDVPRTG
ncbi:MAG: FIST C-terminal domain-containing protein [Myxococcales bacterium]|nr:FIST C-terminal domain-containing protein [Myxococcota bacterium]MDW8280690.1 FIST C-terminal domain-containing protein [Myxococcales bacterium]